ncbi:MAG TPA: hypothetical protein VGM51_13770 [Armatimonadota bacterium]|jgi:hypothetical protein
MKKKTFDCVKMKRDASNAVRERLKDLSVEEEAAYWGARTAAMRANLTSAKQQTTTPAR